MCKYNFIYAHGESMAFPAKNFLILKNAQEHNMQNCKQSRALTVPIFHEIQHHSEKLCKQQHQSSLKTE
jgi:hypothetical protein